MTPANPFYLYDVRKADGTIVHSSVYYPDGLDPANPQTPDQLRASMLEALSYAQGEYLWPDHGDEDQGMVFTMSGPFFPEAPISAITQAEYNDIPEEDLP